MKTLNNFSPVSFSGTYINTKAQLEYRDWCVSISPFETANASYRLKKISDELNTDVVVLPNGERGAQVIEASDVKDSDCYKTIGYLSMEDRLPDALNVAAQKLEQRKEDEDKKNKPPRIRFNA